MEETGGLCLQNGILHLSLATVTIRGFSVLPESSLSREKESSDVFEAQINCELRYFQQYKKRRPTDSSADVLPEPYVGMQLMPCRTPLLYTNSSRKSSD